MAEAFSVDEKNGQVVFTPVNIEERIGNSWDRYRCNNPKCKHYDMNHKQTGAFSFGQCDNCKCEEFIYGDNYD